MINEKKEEGKQIRGKLNYPVNNEIGTIAALVKEKSNGESRRNEELEDKGTCNPDVHKMTNVKNDHDPVEKNCILKNIEQMITKEMNENLIKNITEEEVWNAINSLQKGKSPGIDGIPIEFYRKIWKREIRTMNRFILNNQNLSETQSSGIITLLHKGGSRKIMGNWIPIRLLCSDYKILAKILTIRLKYVLPEIISSEQAGGIQNRRSPTKIQN
jgi:hypothetical protein